MPKTFWKHQEKAYRYAMPRDRIALFMEQRCGKTPVAIRWARSKVEHGIIVVAGSREVLDDWADEIRDEGDTRIILATGLSAADRAKMLLSATVYAEGGRGRLWVLTNYESIRASKREYADLFGVIDCVIADESTKLRNPSSQTTKTMTAISRRVPYRAVLSGMPNPESETDYFSQFVFLKGEFNGTDNFWVWRQRHFFQPILPNGEVLSWKWEPRTATRDKIKKEVHDAAFIITRKQANIGGDTLYNRWTVEPSPKQRAAIKQVMKDYEVDGHTTQWATVRDVWLARIAGGFIPREGPFDEETGEPTTVYEHVSDAKTRVLIDHLQTDLKGQPVVVWFRFNDELRHVHAALQTAKIPSRMITGMTPPTQRVQDRRDFQAGKFNVLLMQVKVGMFGLNLSRADVAIYYSNMYDLEVRNQSKDRIIHGSKRHAVQVIDIVTRGTIDEVIVKMLKEKWRNSKQFQMASADRWSEFFQREYGRGKTT